MGWLRNISLDLRQSPLISDSVSCTFFPGLDPLTEEKPYNVLSISRLQNKNILMTNTTRNVIMWIFNTIFFYATHIRTFTIGPQKSVLPPGACFCKKYIPWYLTFNFHCNYHRDNFAIFRLNRWQDGIQHIITLFYNNLSTKWCTGRPLSFETGGTIAVFSSTLYPCI